MSCNAKQSEENSQHLRTVRFALPDLTISSTKQITGKNLHQVLFLTSIYLIN